MRRRLGEEKQAAMISKFALILLIFNNILIQSTVQLRWFFTDPPKPVGKNF